MVPLSSSWRTRLMIGESSPATGTAQIISKAKPHKASPWRLLLPVIVAVVIALLPAPAGLAFFAWYYFAIFAAVIAGLVVEPLPGPAVALIGVVVATVLAPWVLFSPAEMAKPGFKAADDSLRWALSGFANPTVWLVFTAFMFGLGYEKTGLGRHIALMLVRSLGRSTLRLGYAVTLTDAILAPFTPSNTARSAGTIFPVVRNLPPLYGSMPNEPSARDVGSYIMWTTFAAGCITSSLFLTALAPNLLAVEFIRKIANVEITWAEWFFAAAPFALPLLLVLPVVTYVLYPPRIMHGAEVPAWAAGDDFGPAGDARRPDVDFRQPLRRGDHGGAHRSRADAGDAHHRLGGHGGQQGGLDHAVPARASRDAGRRPQPDGLHQMVRRHRGDAHGRSVADAVAPRA